MAMDRVSVIVQLLASGLTTRDIAKQVGVSDQRVSQIKAREKAKIAKIQNATKVNKTVYVKQEPAKHVTINMAPEPAAPKLPGIELPVLDPLKDAAAQLDPVAWQVLAAEAAGYPCTKRQHDAAVIITKAAARTKVPPPVNRNLVFKVDQIDIAPDSDDIKIVAAEAFQVKL